jgi:hypothetical protein
LQFHTARAPAQRQETFPQGERLSIDDLNGLQTRIAILTPEGIVLDINAVPFDEAHLLASEVIGKPLAETVPQLVWATRPDGLVLYWNQRWYDYNMGSACRSKQVAPNARKSPSLALRRNRCGMSLSELRLLVSGAREIIPPL